MSTYDNAPPLDGWAIDIRRCCGTFCDGLMCEVCGRHKRDIPANVILGSE